MEKVDQVGAVFFFFLIRESQAPYCAPVYWWSNCYNPPGFPPLVRRCPVTAFQLSWFQVCFCLAREPCQAAEG